MSEMKPIVVFLCLISKMLGHHIIEEVECPTRYKLDENVLLSHFFFQKLIEDINNNRTITNDYVDEVFLNIRTLLIHEDFDPIQMPRVATNLSNTFIVTYQGNIKLSHGWLSDLSTIHRRGEIMSYNFHKKYFMTIPIAFKEMHFTYDYDTTIMGLKSQGGIEGKIGYLSATVKIGFDSQTLTAFLEDFHIDNSGIISFHFTGNVLNAWLLNLLENTTKELLENGIFFVLENVVHGGLESAIRTMNRILNPTVPFIDTTSSVLHSLF
ncbi:uncharacterized protein LOC123012618 [Tribolium madens]|uniref:uncharacterized protein LOC123012618 n=1 Tax=Tribolium madens TaxID=41895 RepID=UPI001CF73807|nr:uncharacterized protein LOC123012618 [Tribolium madens]